MSDETCPDDDVCQSCGKVHNNDEDDNTFNDLVVESIETNLGIASDIIEEATDDGMDGDQAVIAVTMALGSAYMKLLHSEAFDDVDRRRISSQVVQNYSRDVSPEAVAFAERQMLSAEKVH